MVQSLWSGLIGVPKIPMKKRKIEIRSFKLFFTPHMNALKVHIFFLHYLGTIKLKGTS
jgi:hypothetical protein